MSSGAARPPAVDGPSRTVTEAIAVPVARRRSDQSVWVAALLELGALDRAVHDAVSTTPTATLDAPLRRLSHAADAGALWVAVAGGLALAGGRRGRREATEGLASLAATAVFVNVGAKSLFRRRRPAPRPQVPERAVATPTSTSFPSGHAATSFAFAYAIGRHRPLLGIPIRLAAAAVAYSRVHLGVHYPGDVIVGSVMGASTGAVVAATWDRRTTPR